MATDYYSGSKVERYVNIVRTYVLEPLEKSDGLSQSCFATTLLVFAAIDGLGALVHDDDNASPKQRFMGFFAWLGEDYKEKGESLWELRCYLVHSALNVASFMSCANGTEGCHLSQMGEYLFIHTARLIRDFKKALDQLESEFRENRNGLFYQAEARLEWHPRDETNTADTTCCNAVTATTPAPIALPSRRWVQVKRGASQTD